MLRSAALAGWLLVFLSAFHELTISSLLYVAGGETFAVVVLNADQAGDVATTAALAVLLTLIVLAAVALFILVAGGQPPARSSLTGWLQRPEQPDYRW